MRLALLYIFTILNVFAYAQKHKIEWNTLANKKQLSFAKAEVVDGLPQVSNFVDGKYLSNVKIKNPQFVDLSNEEIKLIPKNFNQTEIKVKTNHGKSRNHWVTSYSFVPIRNNNGVWQKLISYDLDIEENQPLFTTTGIHDWKDNSVLRSGTWYKIGILNTGIHKIDANFLSNTIGVNLSNVDPRKIKIYGNGGAMLPQKNSDTWYDDLSENAILVSGESDGDFGANDYILFYAQGPTRWYLASDTTFRHETNRYCDTAFYFINLTSAGNGKRVQNVSSVSGGTAAITEYDAYQVYELEETNLVTSGRNWYGDKFDFELTKSFSLATPNMASNLYVTTRVGGLTKSPNQTVFSITRNGNSVGSINLTGYSNSNYPTLSAKTETFGPYGGTGSTQSINLSFDKGGSSASTGYLDYLRLNYTGNLRLSGNQTNFRSVESLNNSVSNFRVGNTSSSVRIWDVTDITNARAINYTQNGSNSEFGYNTYELKEFVVFSGANFAAPIYKEVTATQNLHSLPTPDALFVYHKAFEEDATRLAEHRRENDNMDVELVEIGEIYNEFSSGKKDPTAIRNICKMFYDRGAETFKYLLLIGDCSYDYKNRLNDNTDFVPVYESRNSENPITSHSSDDYFALLDDDEGTWCENCSFTEYLDIGVGRIPAKNTEEIKGVVDKIIHYDTEKGNIDACNDILDFKSGKWKNDIVVIADDSDNNSHFKSAELIDGVMDDYPEFRVDKIYIDAYEQISGAGGQTAPQVKTEINRKMERGALIFNYSGHGGELGLSHEGVISVDQIRNWDNLNNMPLMFTATCEFGRYDDPSRTSAGEYTLLNNKGGVVAIVTTTRPVYSNENDKINKAFFSNVFSPIDSIKGELPRLGDVMRKAKNASNTDSNVNNRNFALLGDPTMRLAYPQEKVVITSVNNNVLSEDSIRDTINALQKVVMVGEVRDVNNQIISDFNGIVEVSVFDKKSTYKTLGDEDGRPAEFDEQDVKIFDGLASVNNGKFNFAFIVPKDIKYTFGRGKFMSYAASDNLDIDAHGSNQQFIVGGTNRNAPEDITPPEIRLFMNDESFVFGGTTNSNPTLLAKLFDENGINTTGVGIGHEITSILDDNTGKTTVLNDFYTSELDDYQRGIVKYPYEDLLPGRHKIELKAWDTYNNSNTEFLEFFVVNDAKIAIEHILNYPNPFTTNTSFHFDHNRFCDDLQVMIQIYTVSGKLIKTLERDYLHAPAHISDIFWDGKDDFGKNIGRGVYVYKVKVRSLTDGEQVQEYQKLVILK